MDGFSDSYVHISICPVMRLSEWLNWMRFHKLVLPQGWCVWLRQLAETENFADLEPQVLFCFSSCPCKGQWWHCWYRKSIKLWRNMWSPPPLNFFFCVRQNNVKHGTVCHVSEEVESARASLSPMVENLLKHYKALINEMLSLKKHVLT